MVLALMIGAITGLVFGMLKSSEPYQHAVAVAASDRRVTYGLGAPVMPRWFVAGNINISGSSGNADLQIPLNGRFHRATLRVKARRANDVWTYQRMEVEIPGSSTIHLLPSPPAPLDDGKQSPDEHQED